MKDEIETIIELVEELRDRLDKGSECDDQLCFAVHKLKSAQSCYDPLDEKDHN